ncbi:MAG: aromatic hydrocarbon degradation protein [Rhizobiales bacterium]|nr:aromatic hydrocarbon degradation protein [Hyphomicrobiales bacterium]
MTRFHQSTALATLAVLGTVSLAQAGGFAVREQSSTSQGASFAGAAADNTLSGMYWNPAAVANQNGFNSESHYSVILPDSEITNVTYTLGGAPVPNGAVNPGNSGDSSGQIGKTALVSSSYYNYQIDPSLYVGMSINAPFGLVTEPENRNWAGSLLSRTSDIFNIVGTPTLGYRIAPGVTLGAGVQIGYMEGTLKFGRANLPNLFYNGDDYAIGWTAGIMLEPGTGTKIGLGYRSQMEYELEGKFGDNLLNTRFGANVELTTPDIVTFSITQAVAPGVRVMGTFEWTDWSDFSQLNIVPTETGVATLLALGANTLPTGGVSVAGQTFASLNANWEDAWFASVGFEYDYSADTTFRAGLAYEESPIQAAANRLTAVPDNNRIWLSAGLSTHVGQLLPSLFGGTSDTTLDFSYTHIWVEDADIERESISNSNLVLHAESNDASVDIISFALRTKFGAEPTGSYK